MNEIPLGALERAINSAVQYEVEAAVTEAINEAKKRVEQRIPEIVAGVALRVHQVFSVEQMRDHLLITVKLHDAR